MRNAGQHNDPPLKLGVNISARASLIWHFNFLPVLATGLVFLPAMHYFCILNMEIPQRLCIIKL